jgi:uncharacterized membrane protein YkoI
MTKHTAFHAVPTALILLAAMAAPLGPPVRAEDMSQQEDARRALEAGLVKPLEAVLAAARTRIDGDIVEIEFEKDDGRFVYEIEYVRRDGQLMEMKIDADSLAVLEDGIDD